MFQIKKKRMLNEAVCLMEIEAPLVASKAKPGQFIIFRIDEQGERIPLTIADHDAEKGTVTIIFQLVGRSTIQLASLEEGDYIEDFVGPLGKPTELEGIKKAVVIGGGVGCAIAYPQAKWLHEHGAEVDVIAGFRTKDIIILEEEMRACSNHLYIATDDGTQGTKGLVTDVLEDLLKKGTQYDLCIVIGPVIMMKFVSQLTKEYDLKTLVSLNPIMIDGTGMCGGCRVIVGGKTKFACVDGPDFDGHEVDFDSLMKRNTFYRKAEQHDRENCRLLGGMKNA